MSATNPLVIVIGAGASKEANLPIGSELTSAIAETLAFTINDFGRLETGGDSRVRECMHKLAQATGSSRANANEYFQAALQIKAAMALAPSIDNFIDSHRDDEVIAKVGKIAIASCILKAERNSSLYVDRGNIYNTLDFSGLSGTWFVELFSLLSQHCSREELEARLSRLTIVSFNYDRCFRHFLQQALMTYYSIERREASRIAANVSVLYPYGSVSREGSAGFDAEFGEQLASDRLLQLAQGIKTFTESTDEHAEETIRIRESVANAQTLVYLGFAFHPLNMQLLYGTNRPQPGSRNCKVLGTAWAVSDSNFSLIVEEIMQMGGYTRDSIYLHQKLTAGKLIAEYSRHLARSVQRAA